MFVFVKGDIELSCGESCTSIWDAKHTDHGLKKVVNTQTLHHMSIDFCNPEIMVDFTCPRDDRCITEMGHHQQEQNQSYVMNDIIHIMMTHHESPSYPTTYPNIQDFLFNHTEGIVLPLWSWDFFWV